MTRTNAWPHAFLGLAIAIVAIGTGALLSQELSVVLSGFLLRLIPAALVCAIAVVLVLLALQLTNTKVSAIGVTRWRGMLGSAGIGAAVVTASAVAVFGAAAAVGWVTFGAFDVGTFLLFLLTNTVIALLLEAIPEELAVRGYVFTALRKRYGRDLTVILTTVLFVAMGVLLALLLSLPAAVASGDPSRLMFAPSGTDPIEYVLLLVMFGVMLGYARLSTRSMTIGTSIGAHLAMLTVNRATLFGNPDVTGWSMSITVDWALLLFPAYLVLATVVFVALRGRARR